jgi:hypothetical protein
LRKKEATPQELSVKTPKTWAAGVPAVAHAVRYASQTSPRRAATALLSLNQDGGIAADLANEQGLTLVGFLRGIRLTYTRAVTDSVEVTATMPTASSACAVFSWRPEVAGARRRRHAHRRRRERHRTSTRRSGPPSRRKPNTLGGRASAPRASCEAQTTGALPVRLLLVRLGGRHHHFVERSSNRLVGQRRHLERSAKIARRRFRQAR